MLSGSATGCGKPLEPLYDLIVTLRLDPSLRMQRRRRREHARHGHHVGPDGDMELATAEFLAWADAYDTAGWEQRSRVADEEWLVPQTAPVLRLDSAEPPHALAQAVLSALGALWDEGAHDRATAGCTPPP
ncbi:MAG: kinaserelated protein [Rhodospirillales bacterium]|nr:kinaserelated protein [Rhodospirillales bacterium]